MRICIVAVALLCVIAAPGIQAETMSINNCTNIAFVKQPFNLTLSTSTSNGELFLFESKKLHHHLIVKEVDFCGAKGFGAECCKCIPACGPNSYCSPSGKCKCYDGYEGQDDGSFCTPYCGRTNFTELDKYKGCEAFSRLTFNKTAIYFSAYSEEKCTGRPCASILCANLSGRARFDRETIHCIPESETLNNVLDNPSSSHTDNVTSKEIGDELKLLKVLTKSDKDVREVEGVMKMLNNMAKAVSSRENLTISKEALSDMLDVIQNLEEELEGLSKKNVTAHNIEVRPEQTDKDKKVRAALESTGQIIDELARGVDLEGEPKTTIRIGKITVEIINVPNEQKLNDITITTTNYIKGNAGYQVLPKVSQVTLSAESLKEMLKALSGGSLKLVFVLYQDASHLTVDDRTGQVIQGNYGSGENNSARYPITIKIDFFLPPIPTKEQERAVAPFRLKLQTTYFCVFWDYLRRDWSTEGCSYLGADASKNLSTCKCEHFTSFALLLRTTVRLEDYEWSIFNVAALSLSAICLLITSTIYIAVKDLRGRRPTPILVNICINLILGYLLFVFGMDGRTKQFSDTLCYASAALMHVTFLSSWFWIWIYALNMYYALVKVIGRNTPLVGRKIFMYPIGYGCPILIVAADLTTSLLLDKFNPHQLNDEDFLDTYISSHVCWLRYYAMYIGFAAPVGIILIVNIILFAFIMKSISSRKVQSTREAATLSQQVYTAITMMAMMGMTWIIGYFMFFSEDILYQKVLSYIFDVVNTCQGIVIFLVSCVRQPSVRSLWLKPLMNGIGFKRKTGSYRESRQNLTDSSVPSKSTATSPPSRTENEYTNSTAL